MIVWSRILDEDECLCIANPHGMQRRGGDVVVSAELNGEAGATFEVLVNTAQEIATAAYTGSHPKGQRLPVKKRNGTCYIEIRDVDPAEVILLVNRV